MARIMHICVFFRDVATLTKDSNRNKPSVAPLVVVVAPSSPKEAVAAK